MALFKRKEISGETWTVMIWYEDIIHHDHRITYCIKVSAGEAVIELRLGNDSITKKETERASTDRNSLILKNNLNDSIKTANYTHFPLTNFENFYSIFFLNVSSTLSRNK